MRIDAFSPERVAISLVMDSGALLNLFFFFPVLGGGVLCFSPGPVEKLSAN